MLAWLRTFDRPACLALGSLSLPITTPLPHGATGTWCQLPQPPSLETSQPSPLALSMLLVVLGYSGVLPKLPDKQETPHPGVSVQGECQAL